MSSFRAEWIWRGPGDLRKNDCFGITDGRVTAPSEPGSSETVTDLGRTLILPGLINAHTHMDLAHMAGRVPYPGSFVGWIANLTDARPRDNHDRCRDSIRTAAQAMLATGTVAAGDICARVDCLDALMHLPHLRIRGYYETIGFVPGDRLDDPEALDAFAEQHDIGGFLGLSPHAPYSVHPDVLAETLERADRLDVPLQIHAAETKEEVEWIASGTGELQTYHDHFSVPSVFDSTPGGTPITYLNDANALGPATSLAHANYLTEQDIAILAHTQTGVVFCPRTHRFFEHDPHPLPGLLAAGVTVALGTDSLASNPDYNLFAEMASVREHYGIDAETALTMATANGADILEFYDLGSLEEGQSASFVAVDIPGTVDDPLEWVTTRVPGTVRTFVGGEEVR
jgi:cytosine/adenosine deaminase-related metal-dependent hydrolase